MNQSISRATWVISVALFGYIVGAVTMESKLFPYSLVENALHGMVAHHTRSFMTRDFYATELWRASRSKKRGVTVHEPAKAQNGVTLVTSSPHQIASIVDMRGEVLHQWRLRFKDAWTDPPHVAAPVDDQFVYWRKAKVFPNGDLLAIYIGYGDTPWGYGLVKIDRNSRVLWRYAQQVHHDVDIGQDGRLYTLTHHVLTEAMPGVPRVEPPFIDDRVAILTPDGREIKQISILEAFRGSEYSRILDTLTRSYQGEYLHTNAIDVVTPEIAANHPYARPGQILLSFRANSTLALLDPETEKIVWAMRGPWFAQHDPDMLANGNIMIFDNHGHFGQGGFSRVIEVDPTTGAVKWSYTGDKKNPLISPVRSAQQRLSNGNTLITESDGGRILEITREGEIVWEFLNPARGGEDEELIAVVVWAERFALSDLPFLQKSQTQANIDEAIPWL